MRGSKTFLILCLAMVGMLAGCGTAGNQVLVFASDTKVALDVSADPTGQPSFTLGFKRREAVWLPLASGRPQTHQCSINAGQLACVPTDDPTLATHECVPAEQASQANTTIGGKHMLCLPGGAASKFVARNGANQEDAYSVMASFGLESNSSGAKIAQYLATGHAARALATSGGAALVSSEAESPAVAKLKAGIASDVDKILAHVATGDTVDKPKFDSLVDKTTAMPEGMRDYLKTQATGKDKEGLRTVLSNHLYQQHLPDIVAQI
ncbi:MAG: hypothetical protein VW644_02055 [Alphaproteobacteria bacterium]|jgi:hypothetical protein